MGLPGLSQSSSRPTHHYAIKTPSFLHSTLYDLKVFASFFLRGFFFLKIWTIFKVFIEFITVLFLLYVLVF